MRVDSAAVEAALEATEGRYGGNYSCEYRKTVLRRALSTREIAKKRQENFVTGGMTADLLVAYDLALEGE